MILQNRYNLYQSRKASAVGLRCCLMASFDFGLVDANDLLNYQVTVLQGFYLVVKVMLGPIERQVMNVW